MTWGVASSITLTDAATGLVTRTFSVTAAATDTDEGASVVLTITNTSTGVGAPTATNLILGLNFSNAVSDSNQGGTSVASGSIREYVLNATAASQTVTLKMALDGGSGAAANAHGTLRMVLHAFSTSAPTWDVNSDGVSNVPPVGFNVTRQSGHIRSKLASAVATISNVGFGGATPNPFAFPDAVWLQDTISSNAFGPSAGIGNGSWRLGVVSGGGPGIALQSAVSNFNTLVFGIRFGDGTAANAGVGNNFSAGNFAAATFLTAQNAIGSGQAFTVINSSTQGSPNVNPTNTAVHRLQLAPGSGNVYGTASAVPSAVPSFTQRKASDLGFCSARIINARGEGVNGISINPEKIIDAAGYTNGDQRGDPVTATVGFPGFTEAGWLKSPGTPPVGNFLAWADQLPGGNWPHSLLISGPTNPGTLLRGGADGAAYLTNASTNFTLLAANPDLTLVIRTEPGTAPGSHFFPGMDLEIQAHMYDTKLAQVAVPDAALTFTLERSNRITGIQEYLDAGLTWRAMRVGGVEQSATTFTMAASAIVDSDPNLFYFTFSAAQTAAWTQGDMDIVARTTFNGLPVVVRQTIPVTGAINRHDKRETTLSGLLGLPAPS